MDINELTIGQAKELARVFTQSNGVASTSLFEVGKCYFIRTVTYHLTGRVIKIGAKQLLLEDAAWVADSGRFNETIADGALSEVEPVIVKVIVNEDTITDAYEWLHDLPRDVK